MFEDNLDQLKTKVKAMIAASRIPMIFLDLDDTLNRRFGTPIEEQAVTSLRNLDVAGGLFGLDTVANIFWAGERILRETDRFFPLHFMLLATGQQIYVWVESLQAYVLLPIQAGDKGQAMRKLAEYLALPLDQFLFIADFPGEGERQEGIDDPVLREQVGVIVNIGMQRDIVSARKETLLLIILSLAATFFLISIALGKAMQQKGVRNAIRRFNQQRLNPITLRSVEKGSSDYAAITHVGRRSGHVYTTPIRALPFGEGFVIPLPYGADTDWCRNVMAARKCTLRWHGQEYLLGKPEVVPLAKVVNVFPFSLRITAVANGIKQWLVLHPSREGPE